MAEVLGVVSGVLALVQITAAVSKSCYYYLSDTKNAPEEIRIISDELSTLTSTLHASQEDTQRASSSTHRMEISPELIKIMPKYIEDMETLNAGIKPRTFTHFSKLMG